MKKLSVLCLVLTLVIGSVGGALAADVNLPKNMVWSCYDVGSSGYVQASAIANGFLKKYDIRVRLVPSGTGIGRTMALATKKASVGMLASEALFASVGSYEFASYSWGPQDIRSVLGRPTTVVLVTTEKSGIKTAADLKGKRVSWIPGSASLNVKMEAYLAFAGLTWDDVERVEFSGYADSLKALIQGNTDASISSPHASILYELESSNKGIFHIPLPPEDKEGWRRFQNVLASAFPRKETIGASISKENPVDAMGYRYPIVTVDADADAEFIYNLTKALDETFPLYKDAAAGMEDWNIKLSSGVPTDIPFHEGAIKYFKEKGLWTEENQKWQEQRVSKLEKIKKEWDKAIEEAQEKGLKEKEFESFWTKKLSSLQ